MQKRNDDMFLFGGAIISRTQRFKVIIALLCGLIGLLIGFLVVGPTKNIITPTIGGICAMLGFFVLAERIIEQIKKRSKGTSQN